MPQSYIFQVLVAWALNAFALVMTSKVISGLKLKGLGAAFLSTFVLTILNATVLRILWVLTLPLTFLTLGLFLLVLNGAMLKMTASLVNGFKVEGWWSAIGGAIVLSLIQSTLYFFYLKVVT